MYLQTGSLGLLKISLCTSGFWVKLVWAAGLELSSALTHTPSLADFNFLYELHGPPMQAVVRCFPDICSTFPFCVAGKGSGMEKALPRPLWPHGKGRRAVGQEPAGHSRAYLWSAFSFAVVWGALQPWPASARCCSYRLSSQGQIPKFGHKGNQKRCTFSSLIMSPPASFPRIFILMGLRHEKGSPLCRNEGKGSGHISRVVHRCPSHSGQDEWLPSTGSLLLRHRHSETRGKGKTHTRTHINTHMYTHINTNTIYIQTMETYALHVESNPDWPSCSHHLFLPSWLLRLPLLSPSNVRHC